MDISSSLLWAQKILRAAMTYQHLLDHIIINVDRGLRTVFGKPKGLRANPAKGCSSEENLTKSEQRHSAGLVRVNHAGEIAAQALYHGQALTARNPTVKKQMDCSAAEENDHLNWCAERLKELNSHPSYLNTLWYAGSLSIGYLAGALGDRWSLGFVVETERQVVRHLDEHLTKLPLKDKKTKIILEKMREDETYHASVASAAGGRELPSVIKKVMAITAKVMTKTAYFI